MIDINTGELCVDGSECKIDPSLHKDTFLESKFGQGAQELVSNEGWSTFKINPCSIKENIFLVGLTFYENKVSELSLIHIAPNEIHTWANYTVEKEKDRKVIHDEYLKKNFGKSPYQFPWGQIISVFDEKGGFSEIVIRYKQ